ncbi:hypothetical protein DLAC_05759 [Tieghemostelium lacteum]|uniref:Uncharacterized protein n=1 Tax=Tieghemostelium lacteum TaxID=361077 RepID=A0A151ZGY0_TIELA|nr:hypothetical protein DLAC_05759 [Tieghemostelium lacteum]|eukprot:KYQ93130.1 hypothetical protein DLAC_05759 [Tieghemostelium lacteum]
MFKSFLKKVEEKLSSPTLPSNNTVSTVTPGGGTTQQPPPNTNITSIENEQQQQSQQSSLKSMSLAPNLGLSSVQPVYDALKEQVIQPVTDAFKDSLKYEVDTLKELSESSVQAMSNLTSTVTSTVVQQSYLPTISQMKESLQDIDPYNGTLLLRSYEIKLKQLRTNGTILAERAEEVDKKLPLLLKNCTFQHEQWKQATIEVSKLEEINNIIENLQLGIDSIVSKIESLEIALSIEIDNYLDNEMLKWQEKRESDLLKYESAKKLELNKLQEDLSLAYQKHERENIIKERQKLLEQERLAQEKLKPVINDYKLPVQSNNNIQPPPPPSDISQNNEISEIKNDQ